MRIINYQKNEFLDNTAVLRIENSKQQYTLQKKFYSNDTDSYYWVLPEQFLGNKVFLVL